jgi:hypothetical protein
MKASNFRCLTRYLDLDFNVHTGRQIETHQHVNGFRIGVENIYQPIMRTDLEMLVRVFINESRAPYCKAFYLSWQGYGTNHVSTRSLGSFDYSFGRLIEYAMIVSL